MSDKTTPRPWKAPYLWDESGITSNSIEQDCQPGQKFKADTTVICTFPSHKINRQNAELIVRAVNEYDALNRVAEAVVKFKQNGTSIELKASSRELDASIEALMELRKGKS